jgi:hypothetical protein
MLLPLLSAVAFTGVIGILFKIALLCVVAWGVVALVKWTGWTILEPVRIIAIVVFAIIILYFLYELVMAIL